MRRLPLALPEPVRKLLRWLDAADVQPLAPDLVPGASPLELRRLAALGAVGRALATSTEHAWPESLRQWVSSVADLEPSLQAEIVALVADPHGPDVLALLYEWVVSGINRRRLGTFFTPPGVARHMVDLVEATLGTTPRHIADPGAGVGAFTVAALDRWPNATVSAIDVNVVTLGLLAARLVHLRSANDRLALEADDYLAWLVDKWPKLAGPRVIIGNPPYTRHQQMSAKDKTRAKSVAGDLITSGLAGLSSYFLAGSLQALQPEDSLCLLLPGSWCETRYGREIRQWLWKESERRIELHMFPSRLEVFPGTRVTAMVLFVGPRESDDQPFIAREVDLVGDRVQTARSLTCDRRQPCPTTFTQLLRVDRAPLADAEPLGNYARIRRGVATGASDYFFLTDASLKATGLPAEAVRAALVKPAHLLGPTLTATEHDAIGVNGRPRWLLDLNERESLADSDQNVQAYIRHGVERNLNSRHLTRLRDPWYAVESVSSPDLFVAPVGKHVHRVIVNCIRAVGSNNFYGIYLRNSAPWGAEVLAAWLRSEAGQNSLHALARSYQGGSMKLEPKSLRNLLVPIDSHESRSSG